MLYYLQRVSAKKFAISMTRPACLDVFDIRAHCWLLRIIIKTGPTSDLRLDNSPVKQHERPGWLWTVRFPQGLQTGAQCSHLLIVSLSETVPV